MPSPPFIYGGGGTSTDEDYTWWLAMIVITFFSMLVYLSFLYRYHRRRECTDSTDDFHPYDIETGEAPSALPSPQSQRQQEDKGNHVILSKEMLWSSSKIATKKDDSDDENQEKTAYYGSDIWVICLEDFNYGDLCRVLTVCNHVYHKVCIDRWLAQRKYDCLICRY